MRMRVHEAGGQCGVAQIDHLRIWRHRQVAARIHNLVPLNDDNAIANERLRLAIEQAGGFQRDRWIGRASGDR